MKKTFAIALVMMLLAASFSFAENFEKENALPGIPSEPTNEGLSQDEAVGIVKQKMADAYQRPLSDFDCHKVKANFVALENGEDAWVVMVDHNNENYDVGAAAIIDPQDGTILNYVSNEEKELNLVLLEQWKKQKGDLCTWTAEEQALFDWLYGTAETYVYPSENQIDKEQATEIALDAVPEDFQRPEFFYSFKVFPDTDGKQSQYAWLITICEDGKEKYAVYVSAADGAVINVIVISTEG